MVLAAMKIKQWKEEGIKQGVEQERKRRRKLEEEARAKFGFEVDGVLVLPQTLEVELFLAGEEGPEPEQ